MERSEEKQPEAKQLTLPMLVATTVDLGRLLREVEALDETFLQFELRKSGEEPRLPRTTQMLEQTCENNKLNLLKEKDRKDLIEFLTKLKSNAPVLHMSFSAEPNLKFTEKLMAWLRKEINPNLLINIGLQPNMAAGTIIRTTNRQFDFSLRENFSKKRAMLLEALKMPDPKASPEQAAAPEAPKTQEQTV